MQNSRAMAQQAESFMGLPCFTVQTFFLLQRTDHDRDDPAEAGHYVARIIALMECSV